MSDDVQRMLDDIRFHAQIIGDAKRTIYCEPAVEEAVRAAVEEMDAGHLLTVVASPACPAGRLLVIDEQALEASYRATIQRSARGIRLS
ncbi:hypothetical protein ACLIYM_25050 [Streptomyces fenghuangensis]